MALTRTQYWNVNTGTVRTGATGHGESATDLESYLEPLARVRGMTLTRWGVAEGLRVTATAGVAGVQVGAGVALDAAGRLIVLESGGLAIVDPNVDPDAVQNVPTVPVGPNGLGLATTGLAGDRLLTVSWREVQDGPVSSPVLRHAPWLRLVPAAGFADTGEQVVLALVRLDNAGAVTAVAVGLRRVVGVPASRVELHAARVMANGLGVEQAAVAELRVRDDGGLDIGPASGAARPVLSIDGATGNVALTAGLTIDRGASNEVALSVRSSSTSSAALLAQNAGGAAIEARLATPTLAGDFAGNVKVSGTITAIDAINVGQLNAQANTGTGVTGSSTGGDGVRGSATDQRSGVWGNNTGNGNGVVGTSTTGNGVLGRTGGAANSGVYGNNTGGGPGVTGSSTSSNGVMGVSTGNLASGVYGENNGQGWGIAGRTNAPYVGASGTAAVYGDNTAGGLAGLFNGMVVVDNARRPGDEAFVVNPGPNRIGAFLGSNDGNYITGGLALTGGDVWVDKDLHVSGNIHKSSGGFRIDHPHDPASRYLTHSFVESNEMKNVYDGAMELDASGQAVVGLPQWFGTINEDFRYQLTAIGRPAPSLHIAEEITDNRFTIAGGDPGMKVSWQVTGVRADPWARANRIQVETDKPEHECDRYLHPELYGHNADKQIGQRPATFADGPPSGNQT